MRRLDGSQTTSQQLGDLTLGEIRVVAQCQHCPLTERQMTDRKPRSRQPQVAARTAGAFEWLARSRRRRRSADRQKFNNAVRRNASGVTSDSHRSCVRMNASCAISLRHRDRSEYHVRQTHRRKPPRPIERLEIFFGHGQSTKRGLYRIDWVRRLHHTTMTHTHRERFHPRRRPRLECPELSFVSSTMQKCPRSWTHQTHAGMVAEPRCGAFRCRAIRSTRAPSTQDRADIRPAHQAPLEVVPAQVLEAVLLFDSCSCLDGRS